MRNWFAKKPARPNLAEEPDFPEASAEKVLRKLGVKFKRQPDGTILAEGDIDLNDKRLKELPDFSGVSVIGDFWCSNNKLTSLAGAPISVTGGFYCSNNRLTSLAHAPKSVGKNFSCGYNRLTDLVGAPQTVGKSFFCDHNELVTLKGAPPAIAGAFLCDHNRLADLVHAPTGFTEIQSDFGKILPQPEMPFLPAVMVEAEIQPAPVKWPKKLNL